jgi:DNA-binding PadR family transcriptional regulator
MHKHRNSKHQSDYEGRGERRHARDAFWHEGERGGHRRGGHPHRGRRGGRPLDQGDLRLIMLSLIAQSPRHGYELIKQVEDMVGGAYSPSPGVVYPTLTLLEEMGLATVSSTDGARKAYAITQDGKAYLDAHRGDLDQAQGRMARISARSNAASPQIERAIENLRIALRLRLERGLNEGDSQKIADALDSAVKAIELS